MVDNANGRDGAVAVAAYARLEAAVNDRGACVIASASARVLDGSQRQRRLTPAEAG